MNKTQSIALILFGYALVLNTCMALGITNNNPFIPAFGSTIAFGICYICLIKQLKQ